MDRAKKLGTYETGVAILGQDDTQQSANSNPKRKKGNEKVCNSCGKTGHKTWRTKTCANHQQYLQSKGKSTTSTNDHQKEDSHLDKTENQAKKVSKEIEDHGDDDVGGEMVVDDFGVATSKNEATPVEQDVDVAPSSTQYFSVDENIFLEKSGKLRETRDVSHDTNSYVDCTSSYTKRMENVATLRDSTMVQNFREDVSNSVQNLPFCTVVQDAVHDSEKKKFSTDVDSTGGNKNILSNSIEDLNVHVHSIVENLNQIEEIPKDFELLFDEDSEDSFFSAEG